MPETTRAERDRRRLERTANHEAGHAVIALHLGRKFHHVTIEPGEDSLGHVRMAKFSRRFRPSAEMTPSTMRTIENEVLIAMAGLAADSRFVGRRGRQGAGGDFQGAISLASHLYFDPEVLSKYLEFVIALAHSLMRSPVIWVRVEAVAKALLERNRLDAVEVEEVCGAAMGDGDRIRALMAEEDAKDEAEMAALEAEERGGPATGQGGISG